LYERALAIWEQALGPAHPNTVTVLRNYERRVGYYRRKRGGEGDLWQDREQIEVARNSGVRQAWKAERRCGGDPSWACLWQGKAVEGARPRSAAEGRMPSGPAPGLHAWIKRER
jgi:hypothetical protein